MPLIQSVIEGEGITLVASLFERYKGRYHTLKQNRKEMVLGVPTLGREPCGNKLSAEADQPVLQLAKRIETSH
jgi:hypothetical protein